MEKDKITKLASIIVGLLLAAVLLFFGFKILQGRFGKASLRPADVIVSDVDCDKLTIGFIAQPGSDAQAVYGTDCDVASLSLFAVCAEGEALEGGSKYSCPLNLLAKDTTYHFKVQIGDTLIDNGGICFTAETKCSKDINPNTITPVSSAPTPIPAIPTKSSALPDVSTVTDPDFIKAHLNDQVGYDTIHWAAATIKKAALITTTPTITPTPTP